MAMQERLLNKRKSFNYTSYDNITSNYYPINSAISVSDKNGNNTMLVMNSRSQGGSVLKECARIELMHNRRLYKDDHRGVGEPLNETENNYPDRYGITVVSNYYLQFFNNAKEKSVQRNH